MTEEAPILRLRAMVAEATRGPYAPSAGRVPKALLIRKDDGRLAIVAEGLSEEDAAHIVASDRIARFIADPEAVGKLARAIDPAFFSPVSGPVVWTDELTAAARAQASATAQAVLDLLAAVGVEHD